MGMNLSRLDDGELFECSNGMWGIIMASAYKTGWKPLGTFKMDENDNPDPNWDKNDYSSHQGQIVNETDAYELSKALRKFIEIEKEVIKEVPVEKIIYEKVIKPEPFEVPKYVQVPVPTDAKDFPEMADLRSKKVTPISSQGGA